MHSINDLPGPIANERGNLDDINQHGDLANFQLAIHREYGRIVKFQLANNVTAISISDISVLKSMAKTVHKPKALYEFADPLIGDIVERGNESKKLRAFISKNYSTQLLLQNDKIITDFIKQEIKNCLAASSASDGIIDLQPRLKVLCLKITVLLLCGEQFDESELLAQSIYTALAELINLQYDKDKKDLSALTDALNYLNTTTKHFINIAKNRKGNDKRYFIDEVLEYTQNQTDIEHIIKIVLIGAHHSIASGLSWTLYMLAMHPEIAKTIYAEVDSFAAQPHTDDATQFSQLSLLQGVIKETMRLYPPGPYTGRSAVDNSCVIDLPDETVLFYPIWAIHKDPEYWSDPESFCPARFDNSYRKSAYLPFGMGARICPGVHVANHKMQFILSVLLRHLSFEVAPNFVPIISENFVLESKNGMKLKISTRQV